MTTQPLSPTSRTTPTRGRNRQVNDRRRLMALLSDALVAHLGVLAGAHPVVLPTAFGVDPPGRTTVARCTCTARSPRAGSRRRWSRMSA